MDMQLFDYDGFEENTDIIEYYDKNRKMIEGLAYVPHCSDFYEYVEQFNFLPTKIEIQNIPGVDLLSINELLVRNAIDNTYNLNNKIEFKKFPALKIFINAEKDLLEELLKSKEQLKN